MHPDSCPSAKRRRRITKPKKKKPVQYYPVYEVIIKGTGRIYSNCSYRWNEEGKFEKLFIVAAVDKRMAIMMALDTIQLGNFSYNNEASTCRTLSAVAPLVKILASVKI